MQIEHGDFAGREKVTIGQFVILLSAPLATLAEDRGPLRATFDPLLERYAHLFAGREALLKCIADFLGQPKGGYLVVTAPAGLGKTALLASDELPAVAHAQHHDRLDLPVAPHGLGGLRPRRRC